MLLFGDRACQLALVHLRAAGDAELACPRVELLLRVAIEIDAAKVLALETNVALGARIRGPGVLLRGPVIADLLVLSLEGRDGGPVRTLAVAVLVDRVRERL